MKRTIKLDSLEKGSVSTSYSDLITAALTLSSHKWIFVVSNDC